MRFSSHLLSRWKNRKLDSGTVIETFGGRKSVRNIGPILASVLAMAATSETVSRGVFMLAVYSAGLAIPFLLTALGINQFLGFYQRFRRHLHAVEVGSGVLLLAVGCLIFVNRLTLLSGKLTFLNGFVK